MSDVEPHALTVATAEHEQVIEQATIAVGSAKVRKTHPGLYRLLTLYAAGCVALGINFYVFHPTFDVYGQPNWVWGASFLVLAAGLVCFLNCYRSLRLLRLTMAIASAYFLFFAVGTSQPFLEGTGSLQLPIMYVGMSTLMFALLFEPFINQLTVRL